MTKIERLKAFRKEYDNNKLRKGAYLDKYLYKLLDKYDLELEDYANEKEILKGGD